MHARTLPLLAVAALSAAAAVAADAPRTMRLDYYHTGGATQELFAADRVVLEPLSWPGNPARQLDDSNLGTYLVEVVDQASGKVLYSRGFDSIFGEWATTAPARTAIRTYPESVRFPAPAAAVRVVISRRDAANLFRPVWSTAVDPAGPAVDTSVPRSPGAVITILDSGPPAAKVDLLLLGEGYTAEQAALCEADVRRLAAGIFAVSPFAERRADFNVRAICAAAPEAGVSRPSAGVHRATLFGSTFDAFGTERYALSFDDRALRAAASFAPYDLLAVVMNESAYGNGGIFGLYAGVSVHHPSAIPVFVHEFGHHVAGLGDEYYFNANVAYSPAAERVEPWQPNVTALLDPAHLKWRDLVAADTPLPTPWPKQEYERSIASAAETAKKMRADGRGDDEIAAFRRAARAAAERALDGGPNAARVGAFEGAMYEEHGYYRAQQRCLMISGERFCAVCRRAIERIIDLDTRPQA